MGTADVMTHDEVAAYIRESPRTLRRMRADGRFTVHRVGNGHRALYLRSDVVRWFKATKRADRV